MGGVTKLNLLQVSAGRPLIAHTGGKSLASRRDVQTCTRSWRLVTHQAK